MALDEPKENDNVYEIEGFQYVVDKLFLEKAKPIKIDFIDYGFRISSNYIFPAASGCSSCGTTGSCCD
jgi:Fe-S cluster assembly iron-binding protein IscA